MKKKRSRIPKTYRAPALKPSCGVCTEKLGDAERFLETGGDGDLAHSRLALAIVNAVPPFGELVKVTLNDRRVWACPRCTGIDANPKPGYESETVPLIEVQRTRRDRRRGHLTSVRKNG